MPRRGPEFCMPPSITTARAGRRSPARARAARRSSRAAVPGRYAGSAPAAACGRAHQTTPGLGGRDGDDEQDQRHSRNAREWLAHSSRGGRCVARGQHGGAHRHRQQQHQAQHQVARVHRDGARPGRGIRVGRDHQREVERRENQRQQARHRGDGQRQREVAAAEGGDHVRQRAARAGSPSIIASWSPAAVGIA